MHEFSIVEALLECAEREARARGATAIRRLCVRIGDASGVDAELVTTAYEALDKSALFRMAALEVERTPARWSCPGCALELEQDQMPSCDRCGLPARLLTGSEITLERMELEVTNV